MTKTLWAVCICGFIAVVGSSGSSQSKPVDATLSAVVRNPSLYDGKKVRLHASVQRMMGPCGLGDCSSDNVLLLNAGSFCDEILYRRRKQDCSAIVLHLYSLNKNAGNRKFIGLLTAKVRPDSAAADAKEQIAGAGAILGLQSPESAYKARSRCNKGDRSSARYGLDGVFVGTIRYFRQRSERGREEGHRYFQVHMDKASVSDLLVTDGLGTTYDTNCWKPEESR